MESQPVPNIDHLLTNIGRTGTSQGEVSGNTLAGCRCLSAVSLDVLVSNVDESPTSPLVSLAVGTR